MPKEQTIGGKIYRCCYKYKIWISKDGTGAFREYDSNYMAGGKSRNWFKMKEDGEGNMVVRTNDYGNVRVDELVSTCFTIPKPNDYRAQELYHKDGDRGNCNYLNLGWRPASHIKDTKTGLMKVNVADDIWVYENGDVYMGKTKQSISDYFFDADTNRFVVIDPHFDLNPTSSRFKRYHIEALMIMADFVEGDRNDFANPAVFHRDMDWKNNGASNLEYVERTDARYSQYIVKKKEDMQKHEDEMNKPGTTSIP